MQEEEFGRGMQEVAGWEGMWWDVRYVCRCGRKWVYIDADVCAVCE